MEKHCRLKKVCWKKTVPKSLQYSLCIVGIVLEGYLQFVCGLGYPILFQEDADLGYCCVANQSYYRFGNWITYNNYHQRSNPLNPKAKPRILMLGDSILNGGNSCDQAETISAIVERMLRENGFCYAEVLNASCGGWALANEQAYVYKFGTFQSDIVILVLGAHDLQQPKATAECLGTREYPTCTFFSGILEICYRLYAPHYKQVFQESAEYENKRRLTEIAKYVHENSAKFLVVQIPNQANEYAAWNTKNIIWENVPCMGKECFRDAIHPNFVGNQKIALFIYEYIQGWLTK